MSTIKYNIYDRDLYIFNTLSSDKSLSNNDLTVIIRLLQENSRVSLVSMLNLKFADNEQFLQIMRELSKMPRLEILWFKHVNLFSNIKRAKQLADMIRTSSTIESLSLDD